ncbi:DUF4129 domain-containing transglutaminase family protein [Oceanobacillus bengalensis]|uniref:Transglutaminase-like domain-containing protein n=2 Tax=Oceanobacillus bengalensis TaxID=1435466 RepID=A0A494YUH7_9BACI|nr:hypothetical protein D8M05_14960 [Oceanobacillus bengalensis]
MNRLFKKKSSLLYTSILYLCSLFLFLEWIYPLKDVTDTRNISVFIIYAILCFFISMLQVKWGFSFLIKGLVLLFIIYSMYIEQPIFSLMGVEQIVREFNFNIEALFAQQWHYLTPLFRSFLFFILIWLMSYLLYYWFVQMKRVFLFVLLTFIYLTVLDTFTIYNAGFAIVRSFVLALIALAFVNMMKELSHDSIRSAWLRNTRVWLPSAVGIILFSLCIGIAAPKFSPQWPDPVPFITSTAEGAGPTGMGEGVKKVGYGEDDSRLGGSFIQDHTPVFTAKVSEAHYYRIETRDMYTGKGWVTSKDPAYELQQDGVISLNTFEDTVETERLEAELTMVEGTNIEKLIYPYGTRNVSASASNEEEASYFLDKNSEAIETRTQDEPISLSGYHFTYDNPSFAINQLRLTTNDDPENIVEQYTQVPETLPQRVQDLAEEITATYDNRYDKAKAIERYFGSNGFEYQTTDVPIPGENQDYVDQFLFDSMVGYCDNFSTSMVVMLRTLDIPARWVKGFTSGDMIENNVGDEGDVYRVTNANAHSWVEVYFPDTGWVPFEPTQGFSNLSEFHTDSDANSEDGMTQDDTMEIPQDLEVPEEEQEILEEEEVAPAFNQTNRSENGFKVNWWIIGMILGSIIIIGIVMYKLRFHLQKKMYASKLNHQTVDEEAFQNAYHFLIRLLQHKGYEIEPGQTLTEFAEGIDTQYGTNEMGLLTTFYEQMLYKNETNANHTEELTKLWKDLINRIMG